MDLRRAVVEHQYRRPLFGPEPFNQSGRRRNCLLAQVRVYRQVSFERVATHAGFEQRLDDSGLAHARKADNAHRFAIGSDEFPYSAYTVFDPVSACVRSRKFDRYPVPAYQLVALAWRHDGPLTERSPPFERHAKLFADPKLHAGMLPEPLRKLAAAVEFQLQVAAFPQRLDLSLHFRQAGLSRSFRRIVPEADDDVAAVASGQFPEYRAKLALRRHFSGDPAFRHGRLLDLEPRPGPGHEVAAKAAILDTAVHIHIQTAVGSILGAAPPDRADGHSRLHEFRFAQASDQFTPVRVAQIRQLVLRNFEHSNDINEPRCLNALPDRKESVNGGIYTRSGDDEICRNDGGEMVGLWSSCDGAGPGLESPCGVKPMTGFGDHGPERSGASLQSSPRGPQAGAIAKHLPDPPSRYHHPLTRLLCIRP